jgi:ribosomal protein S27AE
MIDDHEALTLINFQCPHCGHFWAGPWLVADLPLLPGKVQRGHPLPVPCGKAACLAAHLTAQPARKRGRRKRPPAAQPAGGAG